MNDESADDRSPPTFEYALSVSPADIDQLGHVNNLAYLRWMIDAAVAHSAHVGWTSRRYREANFAWLVRSHRIEYRRPALLGDDVVVRTWIASMERVSSRRRYDILRASDRALLADAETNWVYVDLATSKLARVPDEMRAAFGGTSEID